ncbi:hypothetical protein [Thalassotalea agariperforans]
MFSDKELKLQIADMNNMIFQDSVKPRLSQLGIEIPESELLEVLMGDDDPFEKLLQHIENKINALSKNKNLYLGISNDEMNMRFGTELGKLSDNVDVLRTYVEAARKLNNNITLSNTDLDIFLKTAFAAGRLSGSHDTKMLCQRHMENGVKSTIKTPTSAGRVTKEKYRPVQQLVESMLTHLNQSKEFRASTSNISEAISSLLVDFSAIGDNKNIDSLKVYVNRFPTKRNIEDLLKGKNKSWEDKSLRIIQYKKVKEILTSKFTNKKIKKLLIH